MTVNDIAKAAAEEIAKEMCTEYPFEWCVDPHAIPIIEKHFAPLAEQLDNLLFLVNSVRKLHRAEELEGSPFTHCQCNVCNYIRSTGESDGKEETP